MKGDRIHYIKGMKYVLSEDYAVQTPVLGFSIFDPWFILFPDGRLFMRAGLAWNGPDFIPDLKGTMRGSLIHDVFCILMRDGRLPFALQGKVNEFFRDVCIEDETYGWFAEICRIGTEIGDAGNPDQGPDRLVLEAP